jgi:predicted ATPase/class 3 adenylate cyclase
MECGAKLGNVCPQCGAELPQEARFCMACGASVAGRTPVSVPRAHTPPHLAEKILQSLPSLEGERKQVTVLFADLKGSMELLADRDPEEARKLLDPVLERMMEAVHRYEGTVNQVMGDGVMALFGAPLAHEDHAVRACYAALRMQEFVKGYAQEVQRTEGIPIQIRVGLNSGEVVVRSIGSDLRMDYTAVGQTTHLAARMEQMAMPGSILMTGDALRLAEGYAQVSPLGPVPVKGLDAPVEVYEVTGAGPVRTRLQASAARGLTRFVGRDAEMEALRQAIEKAGAGRGQAAALVGEPGVGKSRLVYEFTRSHRVRGWLMLQSSSVSYGRATPYLPVIDLLKTYFQVEDRDDLRRVREKITGKLLTLDEGLKPTLPAFLSLLDVPVENRAWQNLDPPQRRGRTLEAIKRLLLRESQEQPLLLVFEDLHWIDSETQAILDSLVESLPTARMLLLVNYRPEYQHGWGSKTCYTQLRLDPLPPESAEELLQALLGEDASLASLKRLLIGRTEGNPFFLEESVRTLVETGALAGERGVYRLTKALPEVQVPATVQAVLASRIDRLPPEEKGLLQTTSVIGKDVPFALLQPIADLPEEALRRGLAHLQSAEFLYETSLFPDLEYTFKHALTHEVAYGSLLQERRRALHTRIVEAIEGLYADRLAEQAERLAHHALRGEVWEKALVYCRQAGTKAAERSAYREAVASFEQGLEALKHLPESRDTIEQAIDLRLDLRRSLWPLGRFEEVLEYLREAEALAGTLDDQQRLGWVSVYMAPYFLRATDSPDQAAEFGRRALAIAATVGDFGLQVVANFYTGLAYCFALGDYRQAIELFRRNVESLKGDLIHERFGQPYLLSVASCAFLAMNHAELGDFAEGIAWGEEGIRIAEAVNLPYSLLDAYAKVGNLYLSKGDLHSAISLLERSLVICQTRNFRTMFSLVASPLGYGYALSDRISEALPLLEQAVEQAFILSRVEYPLRVAHLSEVYLLAGRVEEAMEQATRALDLTRQRKQRGQEAYALRLFGEIHAHRDPPEVEQAEAHYRLALALAEELGMRPLAAHCHLGLGDLYRKAGRPEPARAELSTAVSMYRDMEMTFYLSRAEAALAD